MQEFLAPAWGWALKLSLWLWVFTQPVHRSLVAVFVLVLADFVLGLWAARKRGEKITSYGIRRTITTKLFPYQAAFMCGHFIEQEFLPEFPVMHIVVGFIGIAETKSIFENLGSITGLDFWKAIKERIQPATKSPPKDPPDA